MKGLVTEKTHKPAPYIHDLLFLADSAQIILSKDQRKVLGEMTAFNISGRYDNEKLSFYKKCTRPFTQKYFVMTKEFFLWLKEQYLKK